MRLSLYILADWLEKYHPVCSISSGDRTIRNVRLFSESHRFTDSNVYISRTGGDSGWVICMHKNDYLLLDTEDENQVMNDIMDAFDHYNDWSDSLNRELGKLTLSDLLESGTRILGTNLMLADAAYYILAHSHATEPHDPVIQAIVDKGIMEIEQILNIERDPQIRQFRRHCYLQETGGFHLQASVRNLFTGGSHWGWLISAAPSHTRGQMDVQDELGDILEQWMQLDREQQQLWEQAGVFLSILDGSYASRDSVYYQLRLLGWQPEEEKWVYVFSDPEASLALIHKVEQLSSGVRALIYEEQLLALFHGSTLERQRFEALLNRLLEQTGCRCGVSPCFTDIFDLKAQYGLARASLEHSSPDRLLVPFGDVALKHGLEILRRETGDWFCHPALGLLRAYDRENRTEFYPTLRAYLFCERSYAATAKALNLHRNTLLYRIARIQEITEADLEDSRVRLHLMLSFLLED